MTHERQPDHPSQTDLKSEVLGTFSLEGVIGLGSLEMLLDHLEHSRSEDQS